MEESLEELHAKVDVLLQKIKKEREIQPLRDPIDTNLFPVFFYKCWKQLHLPKRSKIIPITYSIYSSILRWVTA